MELGGGGGGGGGGVVGFSPPPPPPPPPLEFLICCSISKRFYLQWNAFDFLYKMKVYFMGGGAAGGL